MLLTTPKHAAIAITAGPDGRLNLPKNGGREVSYTQFPSEFEQPSTLLRVFNARGKGRGGLHEPEPGSFPTRLLHTVFITR